MLTATTETEKGCLYSFNPQKGRRSHQTELLDERRVLHGVVIDHRGALWCDCEHHKGVRGFVKYVVRYRYPPLAPSVAAAAAPRPDSARKQLDSAIGHRVHRQCRDHPLVFCDSSFHNNAVILFNRPVGITMGSPSRSVAAKLIPTTRTTPPIDIFALPCIFNSKLERTKKTTEKSIGDCLCLRDWRCI